MHAQNGGEGARTGRSARLANSLVDGLREQTPLTRCTKPGSRARRHVVTSLLLFFKNLIESTNIEQGWSLLSSSACRFHAVRGLGSHILHTGRSKYSVPTTLPIGTSGQLHQSESNPSIKPLLLSMRYSGISSSIKTPTLDRTPPALTNSTNPELVNVFSFSLGHPQRTIADRPQRHAPLIDFFLLGQLRDRAAFSHARRGNEVGHLIVVSRNGSDRDCLGRLLLGQQTLLLVCTVLS